MFWSGGLKIAKNCYGINHFFCLQEIQVEGPLRPDSVAAYHPALSIPQTERPGPGFDSRSGRSRKAGAGSSAWIRALDF